MSRHFIIIVTVLLTFVGYEASAQTVGYYNSRDLLIAMPEYKEAAEISKVVKADRNEQMKTLTDELNVMKQELVLERAKLSEQMVSLREREIEDKEERINQYGNVSMARVRKKEAELLVPIHNKLGKALEKVILANNIDQHADLAKPEIKVKEGWINLMPMLKAELGIE